MAQASPMFIIGANELCFHRADDKSPVSKEVFSKFVDKL
jgi:hypothetical protein